MAVSGSGEELYLESGWHKGYRIFDCVNKASVNFLYGVIEDLKINGGTVKLIP